MAIPPLPPGSQPLAGSTAADLLGNNLTQWALDMQEVASYMRWPLEAAVRCPLTDIIGILNPLEGLARVRYCQSCFGIGPGCQCSAVPHQVSGPMAALWTPPTLSYSAMVSSTETTASTSTAGVTPSSHLPPRGPAIELMDTLPPLTMENLLATAGISWGRKPQTPPCIPTAPGLRQMRPKMPQQQAPTPGRQEAMQATPYRQQVFPPKHPAPKPSATPSASQDHGDPAGEAEGARGRSSSRGPQDGQRRSQSSTRGSRKRRRADPAHSLMDRMANYVPSGWKRDLTHFIGCCWEAQIGFLERDEWRVAITKFLAVMAKKKNREWTDIKELMPLQFMPYVAKLFREVTGQNLSGLGHFTGWIGLGGYYHWRVVQQGLIHHVPHLAEQPAPRTPDARPSGKSLPSKPAQTETPSTGASGKQPDRSQPAPCGSRQEPTPRQGAQPSTSGQSGTTAAPKQSGKSSTPCQSGGSASASRSGTPAASGGPSHHPPGRGGAGDGTGADWYQMYMHETQGGISEPPVPPYPVGTAEARKEAIGHIYDRVAGKEPPSRNIASRALRAYYTRVDPQILNTWACQILCMIAEYHMACVTRGSAVTSPILPRELAEHLPPLADYVPPEDQSGTTDVWIRDHWVRTLRVAVLCHWLDMALSEEPGSSKSLVRSRHHCGDLLAYFLGPGTAWELRFEDVVTQVLKENQRHIEMRCAKAATSLGSCNRRRTDLHREFNATSEAMEMVTDRASGKELEHRLNSLQTSLTAIERAIVKYENILEDCRMQEEEAHQEEVTLLGQEEEGDIDAEMVEEGEHGDGEPSGPQGVAETDDAPPLVPTGDAVSPEEDAFLMQQASQPVDPATGSHSPRSEAGTVSGEMAELSLTSPSQPGPGEDETQQ